MLKFRASKSSIPTISLTALGIFSPVATFATPTFTILAPKEALFAEAVEVILARSNIFGGFREDNELISPLPEASFN